MGTALSELIVQAAYGKSAWKLACRTATASNITLAGTQTISGVALAVGDRVLCVGQTNSAQNGPYTVSTGPWSRATDFDTTSDVQFASRFTILEGDYAGQVWTLSSPTTGSITLGSTPLIFGVYSDGILASLPSGDTTGVTDRTRIQAAIDAGQDVVLISGQTYVIDQAIALKSGTRIRSTKPGIAAKITRSSSWAPSPAVADADSIGLLQAVGTVGAYKADIIVDAPIGSRSITLSTSLHGLVAGDWFSISGASGTGIPGQPQYVLTNQTSICRVASVSGAVITLVEPLLKYHFSTGDVRATTPVYDVEVADIELDATVNTANPMPNGIVFKYAIQTKLERVAAHGFSRACFTYTSCARGMEIGCSSNGLSNAMSVRVNSQEIESVGYMWNGILGRVHPLGVPRGVISDLIYNTANIARDGSIKTACIAYASNGNIGCGVDGLRAVDIDGAEARARNPDWAPLAPSAKGCVIDMGTQSDAGQFGIGNFALNVIAESAFANTGTAKTGYVFSFRDQNELIVSNISAINLQANPGSPAATAQTSGAYFGGTVGTVSTVQIRGCQTGITFAKTTTRIILDGLYVVGYGGSGLNGNSALVFDYSGGNGVGPKIVTISVANLNTPLVSFDSQFTATPDRFLKIDRWFEESLDFSDIVAAKVVSTPSLARGTTLEWSTAGGNDAEVTTAASSKAIAVVAPQSNAWALVAMGDAAVLCSSATARGDILVSGASGIAAINNAPSPDILGAWRVYGAGSAGGLSRCVRLI